MQWNAPNDVSNLRSAHLRTSQSTRGSLRSALGVAALLCSAASLLTVGCASRAAPRDEVDSGASDAGGRTDSSLPFGDSGSEDASSRDASLSDAAELDARVVDARVVDARVDASLVDASLVDAGTDAGPTATGFGTACSVDGDCPGGSCRTWSDGAFCYNTACTAACTTDEQCADWTTAAGGDGSSTGCFDGVCDLSRSGLGSIACE